MTLLFRIRIRRDERGFLFRHKDFVQVLGPGIHWGLPLRTRIDVSRLRDPWIDHEELDALIDSGQLGDEVTVIDLRDHQRALVWLDGRFARVLGPGRTALWNVLREVRVEIIDARDPHFTHQELEAILGAPEATTLLEVIDVPAGHVGVTFRDGRPAEILEPGRSATWRNSGRFRVEILDLREQVLDVAGQEIMTADKVTLRLNAVLAWRITGPLRAVKVVADAPAALYRETQLALRTEVGLRRLDTLLGEKDAVAAATADVLRGRAAEFGVELRGLGIRDLILPGDMKNLLNQVIEAQKASEANVIRRREETAAMRSQVNTAKLLENNPTLMRLRELETLESIAQAADLKVILGEQSLADQLKKLV